MKALLFNDIQSAKRCRCYLILTIAGFCLLGTTSVTSAVPAGEPYNTVLINPASMSVRLSVFAASFISESSPRGASTINKFRDRIHIANARCGLLALLCQQ